MSTQIEIIVTGEETPTVIEIAGVGPQGAKGDQGDVGPVGPGVASGGDPGQIFVKASATEFDTAWTSEPQADKIKFDVAAGASLDAPGELAWDDLDQTLSFRTNGITVDLAQENLVYVRNPSQQATIPKGAVVSVAGAASNRLQVALCSAVAGGDGCRTLGVAITDITSPGFGFVSTFGLLRGFNTGAIQGTVTEGAEVYVSATPGVLTTVEPEAPARKVLVGYVVTTGTQGSIFVTVRRSRRVQELDDVHAPSPSAGQVIRRNSGNTRYEAVTLDADDVGAVATTDPRVPPTPVGQADGRVLVVDDDALVYVEAQSVTARERVAMLMQPQTINIFDDFQRPNGAPGVTPSGHTWQESPVVGDLVISGGRVIQSANKSYIPALLVDYSFARSSTAATNVEMGAEIWSFTRTQSASVILAYVDDDNFLYSTIGDNGKALRIFKIVNGSSTQISTVTFMPFDGVQPANSRVPVLLACTIIERADGSLRVTAEVRTNRHATTSVGTALITDAGELNLFQRSRLCGVGGGGVNIRINSFYLRAL